MAPYLVRATGSVRDARPSSTRRGWETENRSTSLVRHGGARVHGERAGGNRRKFVDESAPRPGPHATPFRVGPEPPAAEADVSLDAHEGRVRGQRTESAVALAAQNGLIFADPTEAKLERRAFGPPVERATHRFVLAVGAEDRRGKTLVVRDGAHDAAFREREVSAVRLQGGRAEPHSVLSVLAGGTPATKPRTLESSAGPFAGATKSSSLYQNGAPISSMAITSRPMTDRPNPPPNAEPRLRPVPLRLRPAR